MLLLFMFLLSAGATGLDRTYRDGEELKYKMTALNRTSEGRQKNYSYDSYHLIEKLNSGAFSEVISWESQHEPTFVQRLSLDLDEQVSIPNLARTPGHLIGPVLDLLTFYVDYRLALGAKLEKPGDTIHIKHSGPNSWANGNLIIGEDCIDFVVTLVELHQDIARYQIRHVSPKGIHCVQLPAEWMKEEVKEGHNNNWVQVFVTPTGYLASVAYEYFEVDLTIKRSDGIMLSATMYNPVETVERMCSDRTLQNCGSSRRHTIYRQITLHLVQ